MERLFSEELIIDETTMPIISQLTERIPGGFFIYHADGEQELIFYNSYLPAIFGCENGREFEELVRNSFKGIVHPDDYDQTERDIKEQIAASEDKVDHVKYRFIRKDGSVGVIDDYGHFSSSGSYGDIFYVFVQDITEQDVEENLRKENIARIMALEDNFISLYDADLETGSYECYVKSHLLSEDRVEGMVHNEDFFGDTAKNAELVIYPDDREGLLKVLNLEFVRATLEKESSYDWTYRLISDDGPVWARMRFVYKDEAKTHLIVGVFDAQAEMEAKYRSERERAELIANLAGSESAYIVYPHTGQFMALRQNEYIRENYHSDETFEQSITRYVKTDVYEPDRAGALKSFNLQNLVRHLKKEKEYVYRYRDISAGTPSWYEMRATNLSKTEILLGFSDVDGRISDERMFARLKENYFGLYYVSLDLGLAKIVKTGHPQITGEAGQIVPYTPLMLSIASETEGEADEFLRQISDIEFVKKYFAKKTVGYYVYKSKVFDGDRWVEATGLVVENNPDGTPSVYALCFSLLNSEACEKEEAKLKLKETTEDLEDEIHHNVVLNQIIKAGPWQFRFNSKGSVTDTLFSPECLAVLQNDVSSGEQWLENIHPEDRKRVQRSFTACMSDPESKTPFDAEYRVCSRTGEYHWIHSAGRMKWNGDGTGEFYGICVDIEETVRKREEQQLKDELARIAAESSNKAKTEFLFNMSHDIRTPMNAILGYTDIAMKHVDEHDRVVDSLAKIKMSGGHLLNLINEILEMSRIEAGKLEIVREPVYVMKALEGVKAMSQALASTKDIFFTATIDDVWNQYVYTDELHINQVIINLISNAIKYTNPGGSVQYIFEQLCRPENGRARYRITVSDNGIGMGEEFQRHLFESFSREESAAVSSQEGTGLGLAIVKRIVDLFGGTITVKSKKGVGSIFIVELDFDVMDEAAIEAYKAEEAKSEIVPDCSMFAGRKALLVEDNELNREIVSEILNEVGLETDTAEGGQKAIDMITEKGIRHYDFILMDIQMPFMNGYEATAKIREMKGGESLPIIALSANAFAEDKAASLAAGMNGHVAKPIELPELFNALAGCIDKTVS